MGLWKSSLLASVLAFASTVFAQTLSSYCVSSSTNGVCSSINLPSSGDDVFLQVTAPESSGWAAVGIGSQMRGSLIFVIYPSSDGNNVTVSPRLGTGHVEPNFDSSITYTLLSGSGISNSLMTANIRCSNCRTWSGGSLDTSSTSQYFIWAIGNRETIRSDSASYSIQQHSREGTFTLDVADATGGNSSNPFLTASGSTTTSSSSTGSRGTSAASPMTRESKILIAHGVIMGITFVILFPLGAAFIRLLNNRLPNAVGTHRALQITNFLLVVVGFAMGVWYSDILRSHYTYPHQTLGTVIVGLMLVQIALGFLHHSTYLKTQSRSFWSYSHIWLGRSVIILGIVNGGLGLELAGAGNDWFITYGVIAGVVFATYLLFCFLKKRKERKKVRKVDRVEVRATKV